jgi:hypothetical protein
MSGKMSGKRVPAKRGGLALARELFIEARFS